MCLRDLHRTVLHHGACAKTTVQELAPLTPIVTIRSSWMEPLPSHPNSRTGLLWRPRRERRRIHLVKWHEMAIRVDIATFLEQFLGCLWRVKNYNHLSQDFNGHDVPWTLSAPPHGIFRKPVAHTIFLTPLSESLPNKVLWKNKKMAYYW